MIKVIFLAVLELKVSLKCIGSGEYEKRQNGNYDYRPLSIQRTFNIKLTKTRYNLEENVGMTCYFNYMYNFLYIFYVFNGR